MRAVAAFALAFLSSSPHAQAADGEVGRFQIMGTGQIVGSAQIVVLDTKTGKLWLMKESESNGYLSFDGEIPKVWLGTEEQVNRRDVTAAKAVSQLLCR
jgi:hypothetical protein